MNLPPRKWRPLKLFIANFGVPSDTRYFGVNRFLMLPSFASHPEGTSTAIVRCSTSAKAGMKVL